MIRGWKRNGLDMRVRWINGRGEIGFGDLRLKLKIACRE
jgi:hypothetical protein